MRAQRALRRAAPRSSSSAAPPRFFKMLIEALASGDGASFFRYRVAPEIIAIPR